MTDKRHIRLIGIPVETGTDRGGCLMGPDALRTARLEKALRALGHDVEDLGNVTPDFHPPVAVDNKAVHHLAETIAWTEAIGQAAYDASAGGAMPVFMGGDHSLSCGSVAGMARRSAEEGREQFVLWLDAHPDFHTPETTESGNMHGTPVAYFTGRPGFGDTFSPPVHPVKPDNVCMMGIRSVDQAEMRRLLDANVEVNDMRVVDEHGFVPLLRAFLDRVRHANGNLHVSLDVDFIEPGIAPAVGTTVPGGATFREAHLIMEILNEAGLATSLDVVELNPFLDERGRTATLLVDLVASLLGKRVMDRPTRSF